MSEKIGSGFARDMLDRGRRELGGVLYPDSNVAQPMYPILSGPTRIAPTQADAAGPSLADRLQQEPPEPQPPGPEDRGIDIG